MRCLGLDLGTRTCGLAMSDKTNFIASPFKTLKWDGENYDLLFVELDTIIKDYGITDLVLGLPKNMNNTLGFASERSLKFKEALENRYQLKVTLIDERLSTVAANRVMLEGNMRRDYRKTHKDELAAVVILQNYLDFKK
jgi:putative Holliday junction resolvase